MVEFTFILLYAASIRALPEDQDSGASTFMSPVPELYEPEVAVVPVTVGEPEAEVVMVTFPEPNAVSIVPLLLESIVKSVGSNNQFWALTVMSPILRVSPEVSTEPKGSVMEAPVEREVTKDSGREGNKPTFISPPFEYRLEVDVRLVPCVPSMNMSEEDLTGEDTVTDPLGAVSQTCPFIVLVPVASMSPPLLPARA